MPFPEGLSPTGQHLVEFTRSIENSHQQVAAHLKNIQQSNKAFNDLIKDYIEELKRGELTGDQRMDAALLLAKNHNLFYVELPTAAEALYDMICNKEQVIGEWKGGPVLLDISTFTPGLLWSKLAFGFIREPSFNIEFTKDAPSGVRVSIGRSIGHRYMTSSDFQSEIWDPSKIGGEFDITELFNPWTAGAVDFETRTSPDDLQQRTHYSSNGLYFGEDSIRAQVNEVIRQNGDTHYKTEFVQRLKDFAPEFLSRPFEIAQQLEFRLA